MFVKLMVADEWEDRADHGTEVVAPTWQQVREAILALDGRRRTLVCLSETESGDRQLIIAGQWDDRFIVNATADNVNFYSLVDASLSNDLAKLYVGGQLGEYEESKCVPLAWTLEAAEHFFETGEIKSSLNWQSDY